MESDNEVVVQKAERDDRSNGLEILMSDVLAKIKPTDPLRLAKQSATRRRN